MALAASACTADFERRLPCENLARLRAGQTTDEVRRLLGPPFALRIEAPTATEAGRHQLGDDFVNTFHCEPSFSLSAARASLAQSRIH
jgi:hypothetical protein